MKHLAIILVSILSTSLAKGECYKEHLREAIALNTERADKYAELTNGQSREVTRLMIESEENLLFLTRFFDMDSWTKTYTKSGINLMCDAFISMSKTPEFKEKFPNGEVPLQNQYQIQDLNIPSTMWKKFMLGSDNDLFDVTHQFIGKMNQEPRIYCMTRHILESIARTLSLIPIHKDQAKEKKLSSPRWVHRLLIFGQLGLLYKTIQIDELVKPINASGIPMICQDVPPIPLATPISIK